MRLSCGAVIFDLDGTLIDTEAVYARAFHAAAAECGLAVPPGLYDGLVGLATPDRAGVLRQAWGPGFRAEAFFGAYYRHRRAMLPARLAARPGAAALLGRLALPRAVATSASRTTAWAHLTQAGLAGYFAQVVTRDDVARGKPAPEPFLLAARLLGVAPESCVAVEDSAHGAAAAVAAGMRVLLLAAQRPAGLPARQVTLVADFAAIGRLLLPPAWAGRTAEAAMPGAAWGAA